VFLAGHTVAMVTYCAKKMVTMSSPMIGQCFDTVIAASTDKEWKTVLSHLKVADTVFDTFVSFTFFSKILDPLVAKIFVTTSLC